MRLAKNRNPNPVLTAVKEYLIMTVAITILALGLHLFNMPNKFTAGGMAGLAVVLSEIFTQSGLNIPSFVIDNLFSILNVLLLIIGFIIIGRGFGIKTIYCGLLLSGVMWLFGMIMPMNGTFTDNKLLELLFSVLLICIGQTLVFNVGGSTGGFDIIGMIIRKFFRIEIGKAIMLADLVVVILGFIVFDVEMGLYSLLGALMAPLIIDTSIENFNMSKYFIIVTTKPEELSEYITLTLERGATSWKAKGCYTGEDKTVIMVVMSKFQARRLRTEVKKIDPQAFILVSNSSDIIGEGFKPANQ